MSDLISRKSLIENLNKFVPEFCNELFYQLIRNEPTAFDKEKVFEELDKLTGEECTLHECGIRSERCKPCIAKKVIEIVKKGGIELDYWMNMT